MADAYRISPRLLLALCLALTAPAARGQEQTPTTSTTPTTPPTMGGPGVANNPQPAPAPAPAPAAAVPAAPTAPGTPTPAPTPAPAAAPAPPPVNPDLLQFQLKFPPQKGPKGTKEGGSATGAAGSLEYKRDDYAVLSGNVHIHYQDIDLQADEAEIDLSTKTVIAIGNVVIDQGPRRMTGTTSTFNLDTKTGKLSQATARVTPDYYFSGTEVEKTGDDTYEVTNGIFSSCDQKVPDWSFRLGRAHIQAEGYAHVHNVSMLAKKLPVLYLPYILWPTKSERSSGFLIPNVGYSDRRGAQLGLAYFQTLGRSYDTTFHVDLFSKNFLGLGNELRYQPSVGTKGNVLGYIVHDSEKLAGEPPHDQWRWKVEWNHETSDLPWGMRGLVHYQSFSDFNFFRDFERDFDRNTVRFIDSRASATGNWGANLLNVLLNERETFVGAGDQNVVQRRLPEIDYRLRSTRIGRTPFYLELDSSAAYLELAQNGGSQVKYGRFNLFPQITLPIRTFPWLSLSVTGGERLTWYGDSLDPAGGAFANKSLTRTLPYGSAEMLGPSFSRIYDRKIGSFVKFRHVIEPRLTYTYQGTFDDQALIPQFDEVDPLASSNAGRIALDNRVLGKPAEGKGDAREVFLFEIARRYSFDNTQPLLGSVTFPGTPSVPSSQAGPLEALLRLNPTQALNVKLEATYDTLYKGLSSTGLSGNYGLPAGTFIGLTWFTNYLTTTGETTGDQIRINSGFYLLPRRLRVEGQVNYDLKQSLLQSERLVLSWTSQCYGLRLEFRDQRTGLSPRISDKEFRFALSLKNVGTFLDLTSRSSSLVQ
jgi:LPS-assembly protein